MVWEDGGGNAPSYPIVGVRRWSVRLAERTLVLQTGNGGSIPPRTIAHFGLRILDCGLKTKSEIRNRKSEMEDGAQVLVAARQALTLGVRVQVPRASLVDRMHLWCSGSHTALPWR